MLNTIENLYNETKAAILLGDGMSEEFEMGVKHGDPLSSFLFNVDMYDLCMRLNQNK